LNHSSESNATMVYAVGGTIPDMVEYRERLADAMKSASVDASQLASALGISYQAVKKVLAGTSTAFSAENNSAAAKYLRVSGDWLATGLGPREPPPGSGLFVTEPWTQYQPVRPGKFNFVTVVGQGAGGDLPERIWSDGDFPVGATNDYAEVVSTDPHAFIVRVVGSSMIPKYTPGDYALVEPGTDPDIEDDVLVRISNGQTMIKRLLSRRGGYVRLGSYNNNEVLIYEKDEVTWMYYVAYPVPARKIKSRV
jgi:phage repressor protein C with HTH and peptisase S24 domain